MRQVILLCVSVLGLGGCVSLGTSQACYSLDLHNNSDRNIGVIVIRSPDGGQERSRFDLGPGGAYTHNFRQWVQSMAELRLTLEQDKPATQAVILDLKPGSTKLELGVQDGRVVVTEPKKQASSGYPAAD